MHPVNGSTAVRDALSKGFIVITLHAINEHLHATIDDAVVDHMAALTALDMPAAAAIWARVEALLAAHADVEDTHLFPLYEALGDFPPGARPVLFEAEHDHIRRLLARLREQFEAEFAHAEPVDEAVLRRQVVLAMDRYVLFRHLLDHHTRREQNVLYPRLMRVLPEAQQAELGERLLAAGVPLPDRRRP